MLIKELPLEVQAIVLQRQAEYGCTPSLKVSLSTKIGNFDWEKSIEGQSFWDGVNRGHFTEFYKRYPKEPASINEYPIY